MPCKIRGLEEACFSPKKQAILRFGTFTAGDQVAARHRLFKARSLPWRRAEAAAIRTHGTTARRENHFAPGCHDYSAVFHAHRLRGVAVVQQHRANTDKYQKCVIPSSGTGVRHRNWP
jgi:hypothetical protein